MGKCKYMWFLKSMQKSLGYVGHKLSKTAIKLTKTASCRRRRCLRTEPAPKQIMFSAFVFEVDTDKPGWEKLYYKILKSTEGVRESHYDVRGYVQVSGFVDYETLLKRFAKEGRKVKLHKLQFGECCTNLYGPTIEQLFPPTPR